MTWYLIAMNFLLLAVFTFGAGYVVLTYRKHADDTLSLLRGQILERVNDQKSFQDIIIDRLAASEARLDGMIDQISGFAEVPESQVAKLALPKEGDDIDDEELDLSDLTEEEQMFVLGFTSHEARASAVAQLRGQRTYEDNIIS